MPGAASKPEAACRTCDSEEETLENRRGRPSGDENRTPTGEEYSPRESHGEKRPSQDDRGQCSNGGEGAVDHLAGVIGHERARKTKKEHREDQREDEHHKGNPPPELQQADHEPQG